MDVPESVSCPPFRKPRSTLLVLTMPGLGCHGSERSSPGHASTHAAGAVRTRPSAFQAQVPFADPDSHTRRPSDHPDEHAGPAFQPRRQNPASFKVGRRREPEAIRAHGLLAAYSASPGLGVTRIGCIAPHASALDWTLPSSFSLTKEAPTSLVFT